MTKKYLKEKWAQENIPQHIIDAFFKVRRENFMPSGLKDMAYEDNAFPIGHDQTISQPTTIVNMFALLNPKLTHKVMEAGAGSGFNSAVLSKLCKHVYSLEIIPELATLAKKNIKEEKIKNVMIINADASKGYKKEAPYDRIIVTAGARSIPQVLKEQLKQEGILVIPVGKNSQTMRRCVKEDDNLVCTDHGEYIFVEFVENDK